MSFHNKLLIKITIFVSFRMRILTHSNAYQYRYQYLSLSNAIPSRLNLYRRTTQNLTNSKKNTKNNYNKRKLISQQSFRMSIYNSLCCTCLQPFQLIKNKLFLSLNSLQASVIPITSTISITKTFPHVCYHLLK